MVTRLDWSGQIIRTKKIKQTTSEDRDFHKLYEIMNKLQLTHYCQWLYNTEMTHTAPFLNPLMRDKMDLCFPEAKILSTTATADILICHVTAVQDRIAIFSVGEVRVTSLSAT